MTKRLNEASQALDQLVSSSRRASQAQDLQSTSEKLATAVIQKHGTQADRLKLAHENLNQKIIAYTRLLAQGKISTEAYRNALDEAWNSVSQLEQGEERAALTQREINNLWSRATPIIRELGSAESTTALLAREFNAAQKETMDLLEQGIISNQTAADSIETLKNKYGLLQRANKIYGLSVNETNQLQREADSIIRRNIGARKRYEQAITTAEKALDLGLITLRDYNREVDFQERKLTKASTSVRGATADQKALQSAQNLVQRAVQRTETHVERLNRELQEFKVAAKVANLSTQEYKKTLGRLETELARASKVHDQFGSNFKRLNLPLSQATFAVDDLITGFGTMGLSMRGLSFGLRGAANNLSQMLALTGGFQGLVGEFKNLSAVSAALKTALPIIGISALANIVPRLIEMFSKTGDEVENATDKLEKFKKELQFVFDLTKTGVETKGFTDSLKEGGVTPAEILKAEQRLAKLNDKFRDTGNLLGELGKQKRALDPINKLLKDMDESLRLAGVRVETTDPALLESAGADEIEAFNRALREQEKLQEQVQSTTAKQLQRAAAQQGFELPAELAQAIEQELKNAETAEKGVKAAIEAIEEAGKRTAEEIRKAEQEGQKLIKTTTVLKRFITEFGKFGPVEAPIPKEFTKAQEEAAKAAAKEAEEFQKAIDKVVEKTTPSLQKLLQEQSRLEGLLFRGGLEQFEIDAINQALDNTVADIDAVVQGFKSAKDEADKVKSLIEKFESPQEKFNRRVKELEKLKPGLVEAGRLDIFNKAMKQAREDLQEAVNKGKELDSTFKSITGSAFGSSEALEKVLGFRRRNLETAIQARKANVSVPKQPPPPNKEEKDSGESLVAIKDLLQEFLDRGGLLVEGADLA